MRDEVVGLVSPTKMKRVVTMITIVTILVTIETPGRIISSHERRQAIPEAEDKALEVKGEDWCKHHGRQNS